MLSDSSYEDSEAVERKPRPHKNTQRKRAKTDIERYSRMEDNSAMTASFDSLLKGIDIDREDGMERSFEDLFGDLLPEYLQARASFYAREIGYDHLGNPLRKLTPAEVISVDNVVSQRYQNLNEEEALMLRKLKLYRQRRKADLPQQQFQATSGLVQGVIEKSSFPEADTNVQDRLFAIQTTPLERSFLSRIQGTRGSQSSGLIAVDWLTESPWMKLMDDIREHYKILYPRREAPIETKAPISYVSLQVAHLAQVHDLLERSFWSGINVADSLDYSPQRCTVVALYKKLVVGIAILSSPRETYITYLAVKSGWDNSQIATSMLYHLITRNPDKDITLHVSANNPAMLLYNRFGFKAEEFITGFYDAYLDPQSRASKNAIRLRLRRV
ncbi:cysteine-rich protein 2-binding [Moniliophthora roreri MCA 2997]|uniref:Cysteine-rich protein 2-binding n=2 Tax=Moniliophthora roreri TaxID=221103 RepID=V2XWP3_MONRO|nr:cysteine-rich protein 2-binding [Moniliophthora roreri MCA 2997]